MKFYVTYFKDAKKQATFIEAVSALAVYQILEDVQPGSVVVSLLEVTHPDFNNVLPFFRPKKQERKSA